MDILHNPMNKPLLFVPKYLDISKMMTIRLRHLQLGESKRDLAKKSIRDYVKYTFTDKAPLLFKQRGGKFLLFYGSWNYRFDHAKTFDTFADCFQDADVIRGDNKERYKLSISNTIKYSLMGIVWLIQSILRGYGLYDSLIILPYGYVAHNCNKLYKRIQENDYNFLVVYYDVSPDDNCFVQLFKNNNKKTMTLQHGIFAKKNRAVTLSDFGLEFTNSISDYYLAWNQYTKDEAIKAGVDDKKVIVLGIPKYINKNNSLTSSTQEKNEVFGVILNNSSFPEHNEKLVQIANELSVKLNLPFTLRYHPQLKGNEFDSKCNQYYIGANDNHTSIEEYSHSVKFTIISSSSVFVDLIFLDHPTYRLIVSDDDTYSSVRFNSFSTADELIKMLKNSETLDTTVFDYLCTTNNVYNSYRNFFNFILGGRAK